MKPVFWSTGAQTALAEAEVEYQDREDTVGLREVSDRDRARSKDKASIVIWTTTPWTLPANLAIAVHPKERYVVQKFMRGGESETLVLAEKLVPQFCAATGFAVAGGGDSGSDNASTSGRGHRPWLQLFPGTSSTASARSIRFCRAPRSS